MALKVGDLYAELNLDDSKFNRKISGAKSTLKSVGKAAAVGAAGAGAAVAGIGAASTKMAADFEKNMANVNTLLGGNEKRLNELKKNVKDLSKESGKPLKDLSGGLYQVVSAFGDTADSAKILETATKASKAGMSTTKEAVSMLSSVTKGYGDTSSEAVKKVSDLAFQTVKLGETTFPELAKSMGKVTPLASSMGVKMESLFGSMATLTGVTGDTAEVSTQLRGVMSALTKPTGAMKEALKNLGYESGKALVESEGLQGALKLLKKEAGGSESKMADMFGRVEALNAVLALTGSQADTFTEKTNKMGNAAGKTEEAYKIQQETLTAAFKKMRQAFKVLMVDIGEKFLPLVKDMTDVINNNSDQISAKIKSMFDVIVAKIKQAINWYKENEKQIKAGLIKAFEGVKTAAKTIYDEVMPALNKSFKFLKENLNIIIPILSGVVSGLAAFKIINTVTTGVKAFTAAWKAFKAVQAAGSLTALTNPIGLAAAAIGTLVAAGVALYQNWDTIKKKAKELWNALKKYFNQIKENVVEIINDIAQAFSKMIKAAKEWGINTAKNIAKGISSFVKDVVNAAKDITKRVTDIFSELWESAYSWGENIIMGLVDGIKSKISSAINAVKDSVSEVISAAKDKLGVSSPSKVFAKIGQNTAKGMQKGIAGEQKKVKLQVDDMISGAIPNQQSQNQGTSGPTTINMTVNQHIKDEATAQQANDDLVAKLQGRGLAGAFR